MEHQGITKTQKAGPPNKRVQRQATSVAPARLVGLRSVVGNQAMRRLIDSPLIQTKLEVSQPGDPSEEEADRVADTVMRMPESTISRQPLVSSHGTSLPQRACDQCEKEDVVHPKSTGVPLAVREDDEEEKEPIQRACAACEEEMVQQKKHEDEEEVVPRSTEVGVKGRTSTPVSPLASAIRGMNGRGSPLPETTRSFFEPRFGTDFSHVRVHTDSQAAETAKSINAKAFTVGPNIAFANGQYAPESGPGKQLLAHELTHTIQQQSHAAGQQSVSRFNLVQRGPNDQQQPSPPPDPDTPPGPGHPNYWLSVLGLADIKRRDVIVMHGQNQTPRVVPTGGQQTQGFWEDLIDALKPKPCKFYICENVKVCKPPDPKPDPDKGDDFWKWWKWKCRDTKVCWCGLHEVPANSLDAALLTLATAPDNTRAIISKNPLVQYYLRMVIGDSFWPLAQRILAKAPSTKVPSLDEATWYLADHAIKAGNYDSALGVILDALISRGVIIGSLAGWSYEARKNKGEGVTNFSFTEDPVTHARRATAPVEVKIFDPAFADVGWLFSTMMHEYVHVQQVLAGYKSTEFNKKGEQRPAFIARDELEAYLWEIEHALGSGIVNNPAQMKEVGKRLTHHYNRMTPELKKEYKPRYDAAQHRILEVAAGRPGMTIDDARRIVQETSKEIADLLKQRPGNEAAIDAKIAAIRSRRSEALIQVALVDNPNIQVVNEGEPGTYKVPTVDGEGKVRFLHGGIQVAWHMGQASTSAYTLGEALGAGGEMAVSGTAVQGRIHPFPPDIDFDEHIHVTAETLNEAGQKAAQPIIDKIRQISGGATPGRTDLEFRHLITFPKGPDGRRKTVRMSLAQVREGDAVAKLGAGIAALNGGNLTTFWRGILADGRLTEVTRVVFISAKKSDGTDLMKPGGSADFNLAFLEDPGEQPATDLGKFAWEMCCEAVRRADRNEWLKAAKRAYNYFSTIGDLANMAKLEPLFTRVETNVEQYAVVIDAIKQALVTNDPMGPKQEGTRIITVSQAQQQVETVAGIVESKLPDSGTPPSPAKIAEKLRELAGKFRARDTEGHLKLDDLLAAEFAGQSDAIRVHINTGLKSQVDPIVNGVVRPVCPDKDKCKK